MSTKSIILSSSGLKNIIVDKDAISKENDFKFIFGEQEIKMNRIFADFISPKVSKLHQTDPTIESIYFGNNNYPQMSQDLFTKELLIKFELLCRGERIEVTKEESDQLRIISKLICNDELLNQIESLYPCEFIPDQLENYLEELRKYSNIIEYEPEIIDFISSHLYEIQREKLICLPKKILYCLIKNDHLQISSEDSLYDIIQESFKEDKEDEEYKEDDLDLLSFYEEIEFSLLSENKFSEFISIFDINDLSQKLWHKLCSFFYINIKNSNKQHNKRYHHPEEAKGTLIKYDGNSLNGIIHYLTQTSGGNVGDNGTVAISSSSENGSYVAKNAVDFESENVQNYFQSIDQSNSWLKYDFKERKVCPTHYSIRTRRIYNNNHPKTWVIEGSNTGKDNEWEILDTKSGITSLLGLNRTQTFDIKSNTNQFYRFLRIRQTGKNSFNCDYLTIDSLEYFGYLK